MGKMILMEEFHVSAMAPSGLSKAEYQKINKTLRGPFKNRLKEALRQVASRYRSLKKVRVILSQ